MHVLIVMAVTVCTVHHDAFAFRQSCWIHQMSVCLWLIGVGSAARGNGYGRGHVSGRPCPPSATSTTPVTNDADS